MPERNSDGDFISILDEASLLDDLDTLNEQIRLLRARKKAILTWHVSLYNDRWANNIVQVRQGSPLTNPRSEYYIAELQKERSYRILPITGHPSAPNSLIDYKNKRLYAYLELLKHDDTPYSRPRYVNRQVPLGEVVDAYLAKILRDRA